MKKLSLTLLTLVLSFALADEVVIGWSGAVTGPTSDAGRFVIQAIEDYCAYAQEEKILGEHELRCITRDDQYNNDITLRNFESFLDEGMDAFISYATGATLQLKVNAVEEEIPVISASLHIGVTDAPDNEYNFLPITSYSEQVVALLDWIAANHDGNDDDGCKNDDDKKVAKVAMFIHPSAFGRAPRDDAEAAAKKLCIEIVEVIEHGEGLDYTAMLQRWNNAGVQYVVTQTVQSPVAALLNAAQVLGLNESMTFMGAHYTGGATLVNLAGEAAEGFLWATSFALPEDIPFHAELASANNRSEEAAHDVNYTSGLLQAAVFIEAARRAAENGDPDSEGIYEALHAMNDDADGAYDAYNLGVGPVSFSEDNHVGVDMLRLFRVKDGVFENYSEPFSSDTFKEVHPQ